MNKIFSCLLALCLSGTPALAIQVGAAATAAPAPARLAQPQVMTMHYTAFSQKGSLLPLLRQWDAQLPGLAAESRAAAELMLKAASAPSLEKAAQAAFDPGLDLVPQQMAAELALQLQSEARVNPELASELQRLRQRLWSGASDAAPSAGDSAAAGLGASAAYAQLRRVLETWSASDNGAGRLRQMSQAVLSWQSGHAQAARAAAALSPAAPRPQSAASFGAGKGGGGWAKKEPATADPNAVSVQDVMVGVFDADDNLWVNVNSVWVFKKGSNHAQRESIPSEEFAKVRSTIGKSGKYADYEYWDDPAEGSFREFLDQPGRNVLLENLKKTVGSRRMVDWMGKSFPEFQYMLKTNPKGVYLLTASGVSRARFIEALRWLKDEGYIEALPPEENIHCVGNPEHPYYASTSSPSKSKLLTMKRLILDPIQAQADRLKAAGKKPPMVFNADGTGQQALMPVGFSDDDHGNISAMRDGSKDAEGRIVEKGLAAEFAAGAWPDLKFTLFYTDRSDPNAGNHVIKRDGATREMTVEEYSEMYAGKDAATAVPAPEVVRSHLPNVWSAIKKLYFTTDAPGFAHDKVETNVDQVKLETEKLRDFMRRPTRKPGWKKSFVMVRYTISDKRVGAALDEAVDLGVPGDLITDFNVSMGVDFKEGETMTSDWSRAAPTPGDAGEFIAERQRKGWKIQGPGQGHEDSAWRVYSQPIYNKALGKMDPIMHKKGIIMVETSPDGQEQEFEYIEGSGNLASAGQRVNILVETDEPNIGRYAWRNAQRFIEAFGQGKPIDQVRSIQPIQLVFGDDIKVEDSESILLGNTDGHYNLNDLWGDLIQRTIDDPRRFKYKDEDHYEFVWTYGRGAKLTAQAMAAHPDSTLYVVGDAKFATLRGFGKIPIMGGYPVLNEFGFMELPWKWDVRKRVKGWVYLRPIPGTPQTDLDGIPKAVFLLHTKIGQLRIEEEGKLWQYTKLGTFNYSNKKSNAESMWLVRAKPDSPLHGIIRGLMMAHVEAHPEWALPAWRAPFREVMARSVGRAPLQLELAQLAQMERAVKEQQMTVLAFQLQELLDLATTLVRDTLPPDVARLNILKLVKLLTFYTLQMPHASDGASLPSLTASRAATAAMTLAYKQNNEADIRTILRSFVWESTLDRDQVTALVEQVFSLLGFPEHVRLMQELLKQEREGAHGAPGESAGA